MQRIIINEIHGGFGLSDKALSMYNELTGKSEDSAYLIARDDISLIKVVELLGEESFGDYAKLKIVEIPDDVKWEIVEYDGDETIHEVHRSWY